MPKDVRFGEAAHRVSDGLPLAPDAERRSPGDGALAVRAFCGKRAH